jgi:ABC-2 type transport system ATP-binding protein
MKAIADGTLPVIEVDGLHKSYDGRPVLHDLSFQVGRGEIVALLGPNGAGKTTTVEIIEGYRRADRGIVRVLGVDPARGGREHRARVGLMLQGGGGIDPRMTAREVVALHGAFHAQPRDIGELLDDVGLGEPVARTRYRLLSGGERQRVGLAVALVGRPDLLVLDEPTAGMDVEGRAATRALLARLRDSGVAVLLTSHDLVDVERLADRLAIIDRGRILGMGAPDELGSAGARVLRFRLSVVLSDADRRQLEARLGDDRGEISITDDGDSGRYRVAETSPDPGLIAAVAAWCATRGVMIVELRTGGGSLEERYLELIGSTSNENDPA